MWTHPAPAVLATRQQLEQYLETVVLFEVLARLPAEDRREAITQVADRLPGLTIDYVRLDADATLA